MQNHPRKKLPGGTGAPHFFNPVLRVRKPLRIWLLPDSAQATGSLLTRDDSGESFPLLSGCAAEAAPALHPFP